MKKEPNSSEHWKTVAGALRDVSARCDGGSEAPIGFSTRVVANWARHRRQQALQLWQRWSWHGAACSVLLLLAAVSYGFVQTRKASAGRDALLFSVPSLEIPIPSDIGY